MESFKRKKYVKITKKSKTGCTVKGLKKGSAKVQAVIGKKKYSCKITVAAKKTTKKPATHKKPVTTKKPVCNGKTYGDNKADRFLRCYGKNRKLQVLRQ